MIGGLKPYQAMKDSGVPWLGDVPEHWETASLGRYLRVKSGDMIAAHDERETGVPIYGGNGIRGYTYKTNTGGPVILLGRVGAKCGCIHLVTGKIWASEHALRVLPQTAINLRFFARLLEHADLNQYAIRTAQPLINSTIVRAHRVAVPSEPEQADIVRFLDHADGRIRPYIRAKQKLIKLLEEQRQAIVHQAVTRGLDPNVRLKPSGVEWLGEVPEHWDVRRAKRLFREIDQRSTMGIEELLSLRMYKGLVPHKDVSATPISAQALVGYKKVAPGQIVMNRMRAAIGMFGVARQPGLVSPDYAIFEADDLVNAEYFLHLFKTLAVGAIFRLESKGLGTGSSGFMRLYTDRFGTIKFPVPPKQEQSLIVQGIRAETREINHTEERINREILLLREYRARLIADVVTGKLDVRGAAAQLPEDSPEAETLDEMKDLPQDESAAEDAELEAADAL
jgi:type I restriction enzyme, S subunit